MKERRERQRNLRKERLENRSFVLRALEIEEEVGEDIGGREEGRCAQDFVGSSA